MERKIKELINKNIGRNKWKWLEKQGVKLELDELEPHKEYYKIVTKEGEYISLLGLPKKCQSVINFIYKNRLTQLSSVGKAKYGNSSMFIYNAVAIGFNEKEQAWYSWTHMSCGKILCWL